VLTVIHVACELPRFANRRAVAAFVTSTLERCGARVQSLLDSELALARERLVTAEGTRLERLARRDEAIAAAMTAMLRTRSVNNGAFQPLLFEDIAGEKPKMAGAPHDESWHAWSPEPPRVTHTKDRIASTLALVLVVR
jgi:hypothetical protein